MIPRESSFKRETDLSDVLVSPGINSNADFFPSGPEDFGHLFTEWLELASPRRSLGSSAGSAGVAGLQDIVTTAAPAPISEKDALIVIDMQRDFVPASVNNVGGGLFGVAEGDEVVAPICSLIKAASEIGATILASRDYHPHGANGCARVRVWMCRAGGS